MLDRLADGLGDLTPETRKAATYLIENPGEVSVSSIREIAGAANVKPNTLVRLARHLGFDGYEEFRAPFREEIRRGPAAFTGSFPDRARWLQSLAKGGRLAGLYRDMAAAAIANIERSFAETDDGALKAAADAVLAARHVYVLGVGAHNANAQNAAYLLDQAIPSVTAIPRPGGTAVDDLSRAGPGDLLIAMTCKPYRAEVVAAVALAAEQGVTVAALSDSPASPILVPAAHRFVVSAETPQFFPSSVAILALLETLVAFVIAEAGPGVVASIETFHERRHRLGLYASDEGDGR